MGGGGRERQGPQQGGHWSQASGGIAGSGAWHGSRYGAARHGGPAGRYCNRRPDRDPAQPVVRQHRQHHNHHAQWQQRLQLVQPIRRGRRQHGQPACADGCHQSDQYRARRAHRHPRGAQRYPGRTYWWQCLVCQPLRLGGGRRWCGERGLAQREHAHCGLCAGFLRCQWPQRQLCAAVARRYCPAECQRHRLHPGARERDQRRHAERGRHQREWLDLQRCAFRGLGARLQRRGEYQWPVGCDWHC